MLRLAIAGCLVMLASLGAVSLTGQNRDAFSQTSDHPAIQYSSRPADDRITRLNRDIERGAVTLRFNSGNGYLTDLLAATRVPVQSQLLVFSETSAQAAHISLKNPRALFFDDDLAIGWVRGADVIEIAAVDPHLGVVFYTLEQKAAPVPRFTREKSCLLCHQSWETFAVPGLQTLSTFPMADEKAYATGLVSDHRTPFVQRWGGWFVTGRAVPLHHLGNLPVVRPSTMLTAPTPPALRTAEAMFDPGGYPATTSDVVALMVLEHQTRMTNLITWLGWEARVAAPAPLAPGDRGQSAAAVVDHVAHELVDYMLFVDEAPLSRPVEGGSGFAEQFAAQGPRDRKGRSLRELDLHARLFRYPCSYMVNSDAFNALPDRAKRAVYARLWEILGGADTTSLYQSLSHNDRQAIVEILKDTRPDLPAFFGAVTR
jgi:hypothetical protein